MPSSNTITQLLMTYAAAHDSRAQAASTDSTDYATSIKAARASGDDAETIRLLLQRAETATYSKDTKPREKMLNWPPLRK